MKIDRLIGIIGGLTNKERVTIQELADKFEVTKRTIFRDLDTLNMDWVADFVISLQGKGRALEPASLRQIVKGKLENMVSFYKDDIYRLTS